MGVFACLPVLTPTYDPNIHPETERAFTVVTTLETKLGKGWTSAFLLLDTTETIDKHPRCRAGQQPQDPLKAFGVPKLLDWFHVN